MFQFVGCHIWRPGPTHTDYWTCQASGNTSRWRPAALPPVPAFAVTPNSATTFHAYTAAAATILM
jgi:hypothetical protein